MKRELFDTLVVLSDKNLAPQPSLATAWKLSDDSLTLTLTLRENVQFSDGTPFNADVAVKSLKFAQDPANGLQAAGQLKGVEIQAADPNTVTLHFPGLTPQIYTLLNNIVMLAPGSEANGASSPIGTGPFMVKQFVAGTELIMQRNPHYWGEAPPASQVNLKTLPNSNSLVVAVQSGDVDVAYQVPYSAVSRLSSGSTRIMTVPGGGNINIMVNSAKGPTADVRVRQALDMALDRKRFAQTLLFGATDSTCEIWPKSSPAYDPSLENCKFDLTAAKNLLDQAGYADGFDLAFDVSRQTVPELADFAQVYQADLAKIGVRLKINELENTPWLALISGRSFTGLLGHRYGFANQDPATLFNAFPFRATQNSPRFESDEWQSLIKKGQSTPDTAARLDVYRQVAAYAQKEAFNLPLANTVRSVALGAAVKGVSFSNGDLSLVLTTATK